MWNRVTPVSVNANSVLDLATVKTHLNLDPNNTDDDAYLTHLMSAIQYTVEGPRGIGISLLNSQYRYSMDYFPNEIVIPLTPVISVESIEYRAVDNSINEVSNSIYHVDFSTSPVKIQRNYNCFYPQVPLPPGSAVWVNFTAGFGTDPSDIPEDIKHAMMFTLDHWYENRASVVGIDSRDSPQEVPQSADFILGRYRAFLIG